MSIYVMAPVLRATFPDVAATAERKGCEGTTLKLVTLGLADSANEDGTGCRPGVRALAAFAQCHTDTVVRALAILIELGAIRRDRRGGGYGGRAIYTVDLPWITAAIPDDYRSTVPLRGPAAQCEARGPEPRNVRGSEPRNIARPRAAQVTSVRPSTSAPDAPQHAATGGWMPPWRQEGIDRVEWLRRRDQADATPPPKPPDDDPPLPPWGIGFAL